MKKSSCLDILYVASRHRPLAYLFKLCPWSQHVYIGLIGKHEKSSCLQPQGLES